MQLSAVVLASLSVENWACPVSPLASKSSPSQMQALAVSLSYLIYDLICCQFDKRVSIDNTIHHLVSIAGMAAGLVYRKCGSELIAALCVTEISSPFLHLRELLKELGYRDTDLNLAADISFAAIFSFARMVFRALHYLGDCYCGQSSHYQGNGIGITACQRLLVLQDCQDDELQANQKGCF
ncbi:hypothetical protein OIU84_013732 [Salix udensis]|uniref:TLC domain-containing protein n=1 Tax=Salix udensis TaxID=889485 RepID=A0AAD6NUF5_9ROSI|nr:hypothetical protein OIU84_013732 [Salix udensis]